MSQIISIQDHQHFQNEVLESVIPVLVDFWAPWCSPCKMILPDIEHIAERYIGKLKVAKVNIDDCSELSTEYEVRSIPTLLIFDQGVILNRKVGGGFQEDLINFVTTCLPDLKGKQ